jgi:hypothetical protein
MGWNSAGRLLSGLRLGCRAFVGMRWAYPVRLVLSGGEGNGGGVLLTCVGSNAGTCRR